MGRHRYYLVLIAVIVLSVVPGEAARASTWVSGSDSIDQQGSYGMKGQAHPSNVPGARSDSIGWKDANDHLWLFGGTGISGSMDMGYLNDLWMFDGVNWTWVSGSSSINQAGIYGQQGVADVSNSPGGRQGSVGWTDANENFWLFGGSGYDSSSTGLLNDLWKLDGMMWTWVSGLASKDETGVYGSKGVANPANVPGSRWQSIGWVDGNGDLWLFGGDGFDSTGESGYLNDLWKFEVAGGVWVWMDGAEAADQTGVYGVKGVSGPDSFPGARKSSISWLDERGDLWLFGRRRVWFEQYGMAERFVEVAAFL